MLNQVIINNMKTGEEQEISNLIMHVFNEFVAPDYSAEGINTFLDYINYQNIIKRHQSNNHFLITAKIEAKLVGIIEIRDYNHICLFFVDAKYHKIGIGKKLFHESLYICNNKGIRELDVNSSFYAVPIYEKFGFKQIAPEQLKNGIRFIPLKISLQLLLVHITFS